MSVRIILAVGLAGMLFFAWLALLAWRAGRWRGDLELGAQSRDALTRFADRVLEMETVHEILIYAKDAAWMLFGCQRVIGFEPGSDRGTWEVFVPAGEMLPPVPVQLRGPFAWFVHNKSIAVRHDLGDRRFGAMRAPLRELMDRYQVDILVPLVEQDRLMALIGLLLGRVPSRVEREVLMLFRLEATAACANVKLHRQAAHVLTLAREIDLASAVRLALVPDESEGAAGPLSWAGHYEAAGQAGSDFWGVYQIGGGRVLCVIGDAVGSGLAGSMVAAVVKSCCDAVYARGGTLGPAQLLTALNAAIHRPASPAHTRCFAALFEPAARRIIYANAGHPVPYRFTFAGGGAELGVLAGAGPLLGDSADALYRESRSPIGPQEGYLFFTDGLIKARNRAGEPFGERRLQRVLAAQRDGSAREVRETILTALAAYRDGGPLADDVSLVVIRCRMGA